MVVWRPVIISLLVCIVCSLFPCRSVWTRLPSPSLTQSLLDLATDIWHALQTPGTLYYLTLVIEEDRDSVCFTSDFSLFCSDCFSVDFMCVDSASMRCIFLFSCFVFGTLTLPNNLAISLLLNWPAVNTGGIGLVVSGMV